MKKDFEMIPHTADIKIRVYGSTEKELFRNALIGMFQSIGPHAQGCQTKGGRFVCPKLPISHEIAVESLDQAALLVDFLSDALYLSDVHNEVYLDAEIHELSETNIKATMHGISVTGFEVVEIKAVTYHDLLVKQEPDGSWIAEVVFDI
jgi:SHS2 domain-containing protein